MRRLESLGLGAVAIGVVLVAFDVGAGDGRGGAVVALVAAVGVVLVGLVHAASGLLDEGSRWRPDDVELGYRVPVPGDEDGAFVGPTREYAGRDANRDEDSPRDGPGADPTPVDHTTNHWTGASAAALVLCGLGVVGRVPGLVLSGAVAAAFAGYAGAARPPDVRGADADEPVVALRRGLDERSPAPGESVTVTVELRNSRDRYLPDVRVVDGVPDELAVTDGSPRHGTALRPGGRATFAYEVRATRGEHEWGPAQVALADASGATQRETEVSAPTTLRCTVPVLAGDRIPLAGTTAQFAGRVATDEGGAGIAFHATREFRPSDPLSRVDWRQLAKTGELATVEFREERSARVALVVDTRRAAYRAPTPGGYHAVERSVDAAHRVFDALLNAGDRVGLATFGRSADECWFPPGAGGDHRSRGRELLNVDPALSPVPPERELYERYRPDRREALKLRRISRLHRRLSPETQVLLFSPCTDDYGPTVARRLAAYGRTVTVVSPDPTVDDTPERERAAAERADRLSALRAANVRTVDWRDDEPFDSALERARRRWSA